MLGFVAVNNRTEVGIDICVHRSVAVQTYVAICMAQHGEDFRIVYRKCLMDLLCLHSIDARLTMWFSVQCICPCESFAAIWV